MSPKAKHTIPGQPSDDIALVILQQEKGGNKHLNHILVRFYTESASLEGSRLEPLRR